MEAECDDHVRTYRTHHGGSSNPSGNPNGQYLPSVVVPARVCSRWPEKQEKEFRTKERCDDDAEDDC
jgi:hypothetical protein